MAKATVEEHSEVAFFDRDKNKRFEIVSVNNRDKFIAYEINGSKRKKLGEADTPLELEEKYRLMEKLA